MNGRFSFQVFSIIIQSIFVWLILGSLLLSCNGSEDVDMSDDIEYQELVYGEHGLKLDLWRSSNIKYPDKILLFVHGGLWYCGDKSLWPQSVAETLAKNGFMSASINYRLYPDGDIHDQLMDIRDAIDFLSSEIYRISNVRPSIYLVGHSSGAHLVSLYSALFCETDDRISGVVCFDGGEYLTENPDDMDASPSYRYIKDRFLKACATTPPINNIPYFNFKGSSYIAPILLVCQRDDDYRFEPNSKLFRLLQSLSVDVSFLPVIGYSHDTIYLGIADSDSEMFNSLKLFLENH